LDLEALAGAAAGFAATGLAALGLAATDLPAAGFAGFADFAGFAFSLVAAGLDTLEPDFAGDLAGEVLDEDMDK
jgi:hypothetical protein